MLQNEAPAAALLARGPAHNGKRFIMGAKSLPLSDREVERFWSNVDKEGPVHPHHPELGKCWLWTGRIDRYAVFALRGRDTRAHRVSFLIANGHFPTPCGCHSCDRKNCVNPDHIWEGSNADNHADMMMKGRHRHHEVIAPRGPAMLLRAWRKYIGMQQGELAGFLSVHRTAVSHYERGTGRPELRVAQMIEGLTAIPAGMWNEYYAPNSHYRSKRSSPRTTGL